MRDINHNKERARRVIPSEGPQNDQTDLESAPIMLIRSLSRDKDPLDPPHVPSFCVILAIALYMVEKLKSLARVIGRNKK